MHELTKDAPSGATPHDTLTLSFERRQKSRQRARLDGGEEVGVLLTRGRVLRGGDKLASEDGTWVVEVRAATELVSEARAGDAVLLARAAYHLGNRHVAVQVGDGWVRYLHDHVLDDMVRGLGLAVKETEAPFEPEAGAYGRHSHGHAVNGGHDHAHAGGHGHDHGHEHDYEPEHEGDRRRSQRVGRGEA